LTFMSVDKTMLRFVSKNPLKLKCIWDVSDTLPLKNHSALNTYKSSKINI
jgi:hypothetical protein